MKQLLQLTILFFLLCFSTQTKATHIVGGELTYTCLGEDDYEIQLTIFRDCYNGSPQAWFDDPASIGIFDPNTNSLINQILIPLDPMLNDTLEPTLFGECFVIPPDVCVHTTTYTTTVNLPFMTGGYILAYQRCCRNVTIDNIVDPLATGATYSVTISERALEECNSSPKFNVWPPLYICANEPIFFDQSTTDQDGDSIVYTLCTPQTGADQDNPMPQPPNNPPYAPITWLPGFSEADMLNGQNGTGQPLMINSETGFLSGLPLFIGQYVVGICAEEYRDGELIGTTRRDFQYNVGECGQPVSAFFAPAVQCDDLDVEFDNQSLNSNFYAWYFDFENNPDWFSMEENPSYSYPDFGTYEVMLVANPNSDCEDTIYQTVNLIPNSLTPNFEVNLEDCAEDVTIVITDLSIDESSFITNWDWTFNMPGNIQTSTEQDPIFTAINNGNAMITLTITSESGCQSTTIQFVEIDLIFEELVADTLTICPGDAAFLNPNFNTDYSYSWSPITGLDNPNAPNPLASPTETTTYSVQVSNLLTNCSVEREITVFVPQQLTVTLPPDFTTCDTDIELTAETNTGISFFWATDPDFDFIFSNEETVSVTPFGETTYYLLVRDEYNCAATDQITIIGNGINVDYDTQNIICQGESITLNIQNLDPNDILTYNWLPLDNIVSGQSSNMPTIFLENAGTYTYYLEMSNQFECILIDTIVVAALDTLDQTGFVNSVQCSGYSVHFFNESINAPYYIWDFGDPTTTSDVSTEENPVYEYSSPGIYTVTLSFPPSITCAEPIITTVSVTEPQITPDFDAEITECSDTILIAFTDMSQNNQGTILDYSWEFSNGATANGEAVEITVYESQVLAASLIITSDDGCVDTLSQEYPIEILNPLLPDSIIVCNNEPTELNPNADTNLQYNWSPDNFLSDNTIANPLANPPVTTVYSVTISDNSGAILCEVVRDITVFVAPPLSITIAGDTLSCGEPLELTSTSINGIEWSNTADFSTIFSTENTVLVESGREDIFYARSFDNYGCSVVDSILTNNFEPQISLNPELVFCGQDTLTLEVENLIPDDILSYNWSPENEIIGYTEEGFALVSPLQTTSYSVTATNQYDCSTSTSTTVTITQTTLPLNVTASDTTLFAGQSTSLFATPYGSVIYTWSPAASLSSTSIPDPIATPLETTTYRVEIVDINGCTSFAFITITVTDATCEDPFVYIPNTFSPDGDDTNETFTVLGAFIEEVYLVVYNRWGEKMFETNTVGEAWDGTLEGRPLSPDVYAYYCRVLCAGGEEIELKGNVTLLK